MAPFYSGTEREHQRTVVALLRGGDVAVDAGANWGIHTLLFARCVGPQGRVIAVEPSPAAREELEWHVQHNACHNVRIVPLALDHSEGAGRFAASPSAYTGHLLPNGEANGSRDVQGGVTVQTTTLDLLLERENCATVRLVKLDVEGAESRVLRGAQRILREVRPYFVIELHTPDEDVAVGQFLHDARYEIARLSGPAIRRLDRGWPEPDGIWGTILATPK
jgi:FkbM family methyltransferase